MNEKWAAGRRSLPAHRFRFVSVRKRAASASLVVLSFILPLTAACGNGGRLAAAPHISSLTAAGSPGAANHPITVQGTITDASTGRPVTSAHVTYDKRVVSSDANGGFRFQSVPAKQTLYVVAAGYRRSVSPWNAAQPQIKLTPFQVRGLYMPFVGLTNPQIMATIDKDTTNTEINTVVIEVKTDDGQISDQMATPAAQAAHAVVPGIDLKGFVQKMHDRGIYVVGRFVAFRDPILATAHPDWALRLVSNNQPYEDEQGQKWIDGFRQEVQQYDLDIAEKAAQTGLDEIQFDYVRFPGAISSLQYAEPFTQENRVAAISGFLKQAEERLRPYGVALSADTFGETTIAADDTGIGQDITTLGQYIDYYCPMVYPSTWADGAFDVAYPAADPYTIVLASTQSAIKRLAEIPTVRVRPWLQAFDDYNARQLSYTPDMVNTQKKAAADAGASGWMLWHPLSHFDAGVIGPPPDSAPTPTP